MEHFVRQLIEINLVLNRPFLCPGYSLKKVLISLYIISAVAITILCTECVKMLPLDMVIFESRSRSYYEKMKKSLFLMGAN